MKTPPDIDEVHLVRALRDDYGLVDPKLTFLPVGEEAWSYQASCANGSRYHLKIYRKSLNWDAALGIPHELRQRHGLMNAVGPLRTINGDLKTTIDVYNAALFPWIDGLTVMERSLDRSQLVEVGRMLAELHSKASVIETPCDREKFDASESRATYMRIIKELALAVDSENPYRRELANLLLPLKGRLLREWSDFENAALWAKREGEPFVLCHHDLTMGNLILGDRIYLVDWDWPILAPKECDLIHFHGDHLVPVLEGYASVAGPIHLNDYVLDYYRLAWNTGEIVDYGTKILFQTQDHNQNAHDLDRMKEFLDYSGLG